MKTEFVAGIRYLRWDALGWQINDDNDGIAIPMGIAINLSGLYAEYGGNNIALIAEIIHTIEHETIHFCIHSTAYFLEGIDQEEVTNMLQVTSRCHQKYHPFFLPEEDNDFLVGYL